MRRDDGRSVEMRGACNTRLLPCRGSETRCDCRRRDAWASLEFLVTRMRAALAAERSRVMPEPPTRAATVRVTSTSSGPAVACTRGKVHCDPADVAASPLDLADVDVVGEGFCSDVERDGARRLSVA